MRNLCHSRSETHTFHTCAAHLSVFLICLSYRQCPIRPFGAPSPRGEGFVRRYSFSTYACIHSDNARKAVFSYRSLPPWGRGTAQRRSGVLVNDALVTIFFALFHTASPIQPPPLWGTSFHRKEGVSTRAPSLGRGCRAQRGGVGFLLGRRSPLLFAFPIWERGPRAALGYSRKRRTCDDLLRSFSSRQNPIRPPSWHLPPWGKALCRGTAALSQMPRLHSVQTKTALRRLALQSGFWFYYSTVTDFARFLGLSTSFPLLIEV